MKSPLTGKQTRLEARVTASKIIKSYENQFGCNVGYLFKGIEQVELYRCLETGYRFFHPFNIIGDNRFYQHFQKYDWYYMPWKWEHQQASLIVTDGMKVLEVGCGNGDFLKRIQAEKNAICVGLEFNKEAVLKGRINGVDIFNETIENHALLHVEEYDMVCTFQVLEHIPNILSFLTSLVKCLKKGGKLILSVPNNDSFLGYGENILNMPPHHMGLWNKKSLLSLRTILPIVPENLYLEPLQPYHEDYFKQTTTQFLHNRFKMPNKIAYFIYPLIKSFATRNFKAFTIQVKFRKNETA